MNGSFISSIFASKDKRPSLRTWRDKSSNNLIMLAGSYNFCSVNKTLKRVGILLISFNVKAFAIAAAVPTKIMIIAPGLIRTAMLAPFAIMPTTTALIPRIIPTITE